MAETRRHTRASELRDQPKRSEEDEEDEEPHEEEGGAESPQARMGPELQADVWGPGGCRHAGSARPRVVRLIGGTSGVNALPARGLTSEHPKSC